MKHIVENPIETYKLGVRRNLENRNRVINSIVVRGNLLCLDDRCMTLATLCHMLPASDNLSTRARAGDRKVAKFLTIDDANIYTLSLRTNAIIGGLTTDRNPIARILDTVPKILDSIDSALFIDLAKVMSGHELEIPFEREYVSAVRLAAHAALNRGTAYGNAMAYIVAASSECNYVLTEVHMIVGNLPVAEANSIIDDELTCAAIRTKVRAMLSNLPKVI